MEARRRTRPTVDFTFLGELHDFQVEAAAVAMDVFRDAMMETVALEGRFVLQSFEIFTKVKRAAREAVDRFGTGKRIRVPEKTAVKFTMSERVCSNFTFYG
jgi:nucleoid DNA-binding protein